MEILTSGLESLNTWYCRNWWKYWPEVWSHWTHDTVGSNWWKYWPAVWSHWTHDTVGTGVAGRSCCVGPSCWSWSHTGSTENRTKEDIYGLVWEKCNSSALAMEIRLSCTNPSIYSNSYKKYLRLYHTCIWNRFVNKDLDLLPNYYRQTCCDLHHCIK